MNKIVEVNIVDNVVKYKVITNVSILNADSISIYIDECDNVSRFYQDSAEFHDYVFDNENSTITVKQISQDGEAQDVTVVYTYEVSIVSDVIKNFDRNLKYIKMYCTTESYANDYVDGVFYDPVVLYDAEVKMLHSYCSTCLDDKQMQKVMILVFKRQLLEQAIATSHNKEAAQYYLDLVRLLSVNINKTCYSDEQKCSNGMCRL